MFWRLCLPSGAVSREGRGRPAVKERRAPSWTRRYFGRRIHSAVSKISGEVYETTDRIAAIFLAGSVKEKTQVATSEEPLHSVLAIILECRTALIESGNLKTAQLLSVAALELRMKLNGIADAELKSLCDAMLPDDMSVERSQELKASQSQRRRPILKLVK